MIDFDTMDAESYITQLHDIIADLESDNKELKFDLECLQEEFEDISKLCEKHEFTIESLTNELELIVNNNWLILKVCYNKNYSYVYGKPFTTDGLYDKISDEEYNTIFNLIKDKLKPYLNCINNTN